MNKFLLVCDYKRDERYAIKLAMNEKLKFYLISQWENAMNTNKENILKLLSEDRQARFLDLGCDNGDWTTIVKYL